jgi:hypothetical protein
VAEDLLLGALRFFVAGLSQGAGLLRSLHARLAAILFEQLPVGALNSGERLTDLAADAGVTGFLSGADAHVVGRLELPAFAHAGHGAEVVHPRIGGAGIDHLIEERFRLIVLAGEISMDAAAIEFGHFARALGKHALRDQGKACRQ